MSKKLLSQNVLQHGAPEKKKEASEERLYNLVSNIDRNVAYRSGGNFGTGLHTVTNPQQLGGVGASNLGVRNVNISSLQSGDYNASNDEYVQKQKEDILELTSFFKDKLVSKEIEDNSDLVIKKFEEYYNPIPGFIASYKLTIHERKTPLTIQINHIQLLCNYGYTEKSDVEMDLNQGTLNDIMYGRMTFQRAFMAGNMKMKGDFKTFRTLDLLFPFIEN